MDHLKIYIFFYPIHEVFKASYVDLNVEMYPSAVFSDVQGQVSGQP